MAGNVSQAVDGFLPGETNSFAWNTTVPVEEKPILVYVFNGHVYEGSEFEYSSSLEQGAFADRKIRDLARNFICEKVCVADEELLREVAGRESVSTYLRSFSEKKEKPSAHVALLDSHGRRLGTLDDRTIARGPGAVAKELKRCLQINAERAEAARAQGDS